MKIILTRHGATDGNLEKRYIGAGSDEPLSDKGRVALECISRWPGVEQVYTSGMLRTRQTAAILYPGAHQVEIENLREMNFGEFESKNWSELSENTAYRYWVEGGCVDYCPGGESRQEFVSRCVTAFQGVLSEQKGCNELHFVVHGGTIMALLSTMAVHPKDYFHYETPCGTHWVCRLDKRYLEILQAPEEGKL